MEKLVAVTYHGREAAQPDDECTGRGFAPSYRNDWYVEPGDYAKFIADYKEAQRLNGAILQRLRRITVTQVNRLKLRIFSMRV
jgi:hypothetical protein